MSRTSVKDNVETATESTQAQIDSLRSQLQKLLESASPALLNAADRTEHVVANAREITDHKLERVSTRVRAQPIAAVLVSALFGFVAGRFSK